jgi:hypothetical protein
VPTDRDRPGSRDPPPCDRGRPCSSTVEAGEAVDRSTSAVCDIAAHPPHAIIVNNLENLGFPTSAFR